MSKNDDDKYLDPARNPWIPVGDEDNPGVSCVRPGEVVDLNPDGLIPVNLNTDDPLHGLDMERVKKFIGASGTAYVYDGRFYSPDATTEERLSMKPRLLLTRDGDNVQVKRADGVSSITSDEAALVKLAIERKGE